MFDLVYQCRVLSCKEESHSVKDLFERYPINEIINNNRARTPAATPNYRLVLHEPLYYPF